MPGAEGAKKSVKKPAPTPTSIMDQLGADKLGPASPRTLKLRVEQIQGIIS